MVPTWNTLFEESNPNAHRALKDKAHPAYSEHVCNHWTGTNLERDHFDRRLGIALWSLLFAVLLWLG
jgi:hypothetical protein